LRKHRAIKFFFAIVLSLPFTNLCPETSIDYKYKLIQEADVRALANERYWRLLLHYKKKSFGRFESEIDSPEFFLSKDGKTNPESELRETIKSFFEPVVDMTEEKFMHPQCSYPARYNWLKNKLKFDSRLLPEIQCKRFSKWSEALNPGSIRHVFSSFYMNNPASIFGHSLFKINTKREETQDILDYGVNFAAVNDDSNPFLYAVKGLLGGYPGKYSIMPYYVKVNEYNDNESRDLWEYELDFDKKEIDRFMSHLWELGKSYNWYYYFSENCSYQLLGLLEIARPTLFFSDKFPFWVKPAETIRIVNQSGIVKKKIYRPSLYTRIKDKLKQLNDSEREEFYSVLKMKKDFQNISVESENKKSIIADALLDSLRFREYANIAKEKEKKLYRNLLLERTKLPSNPEIEISRDKDMAVSPELTHLPVRAKVGFGTRGNEPFTEFSIRPTLTDLLNVDAGYPPNSEFQFFSLNLRKYSDSKNISLEEFHLLRIFSLPAYSPITEHKSYMLDSGIETVKIKNEKSYGKNEQFLSDFNSFWSGISNDEYKRIHAGKLEFLYGFTIQNDYSKNFSNLVVSVLAGGKLNYSRSFDNNARFGPEISMNVIYKYGNFKFLLNTSFYGYSVSGNLNNYKLLFQSRYAISENQEIRFDYRKERFDDEKFLSYSLLF